MKRTNYYRDQRLEGWIGSRADGVLHATVPDTIPEKKRPGPEAEPGFDEADICLSCKAPVCAMDKNQRCARLAREKRKRREEKQKEATQNDKGSDGSDPR